MKERWREGFADNICNASSIEYTKYNGFKSHNDYMKYKGFGSYDDCFAKIKRTKTYAEPTPAELETLKNEKP